MLVMWENGEIRYEVKGVGGLREAWKVGQLSDADEGWPQPYRKICWRLCSAINMYRGYTDVVT
jgi:hypothetical protein